MKHKLMFVYHCETHDHAVFLYNTLKHKDTPCPIIRKGGVGGALSNTEEGG